VTSHWVETEMVACQLHDAWHAKRLVQLLAHLSEAPVHSIPRGCHGWAETVAAYRLLDNPVIGEQEMLSGPQHATLERMRVQELVLSVQATTFLDDGTTQPKQGMGTVQIKVSLTSPTQSDKPIQNTVRRLDSRSHKKLSSCIISRFHLDQQAKGVLGSSWWSLGCPQRSPSFPKG
jgi:hypothetical protein